MSFCRRALRGSLCRSPSVTRFRRISLAEQDARRHVHRFASLALDLPASDWNLESLRFSRIIEASAGEPTRISCTAGAALPSALRTSCWATIPQDPSQSIPRTCGCSSAGNAFHDAVDCGGCAVGVNGREDQNSEARELPAPNFHRLIGAKLAHEDNVGVSRPASRNALGVSRA